MSSPLFSTIFATKYTRTENKEKTVNRYRSNARNNKERINKKIIFRNSVILPVGITSGIALGYLSEKGIETLAYRASKKDLYNRIKKYYNAVPAIYMQPKAGIHWCWLSCIRALYKFHNFDISDEELYQKLTNRSPEFFMVNRLSGSRLEEEFDMNFSSVTTQLKPIFARIQVKRSEGVNKILENIKKFHNYIGKIPFYVRDSDEDAKGGGHAVNIVDISDKSFVIEEPDTQLQYKRDAYDYCVNFFQDPRNVSENKVACRLIALVKSDSPIKSLHIEDGKAYELIKINENFAYKTLDSENRERFNNLVT